MRTGIMQPYFFPYLGYFQLINEVDYFVLYDDVTYIKGGWINRNRIYDRQSFNYWTMSLDHASSNRLIKDIKFLKETWKNLLKTLKQNYSKAPNFDFVFDMVSSIAENNKLETITDLNHFSIKLICDYLEIKTPIYRSSELDVCHFEGKKVERLVCICKHFNCDVYINPEGGQELYSKEDFEKYGIGLYFIRMTPVIYKQFTDFMVENLSIIDVLMFNSKEKIQKFLNYNFVMK